MDGSRCQRHDHNRGIVIERIEPMVIPQCVCRGRRRRWQLPPPSSSDYATSATSFVIIDTITFFIIGDVR
jgi:hypothetical protein